MGTMAGRRITAMAIVSVVSAWDQSRGNSSLAHWKPSKQGVYWSERLGVIYNVSTPGIRVVRKGAKKLYLVVNLPNPREGCQEKILAWLYAPV
jgi:hypothetical protein